MEIALIILGFLSLIAGLIGSIVPALPGPPLCYFGLLLLKWSGKADFSLTFLIIWAAITVVVMIMDNVLPMIMTKKFGGSRNAVIGSVVGLIIGMIFFAPLGLIVGPFLGALAGELLNNHILEKSRIKNKKDNETETVELSHTAKNEKAIIAALGAFLAFILGTGAKLIIGSLMIFFAIKAMF